MAIKFLFDSNGRHIANIVNAQLHSPSGQNIGHYLEKQMIFIDMHGKYLGEIVSSNRLMYKKQSQHKPYNFGVLGNFGNAGNYGNPGHGGSIGFVSGYADVQTTWLSMQRV